MLFRSSTHAPANNPETKAGSIEAMLRIARSHGEACNVSTATNGNAVREMSVPNADTVAAVHSFMKSGFERRLPVRRIVFTFAGRRQLKTQATQTPTAVLATGVARTIRPTLDRAAI